MILGDDRGANIYISECEFKYSRFIKGLISYERLPKLESTDTTTVINIAKEFWTRFPEIYTQPPEISISSSQFYNLALGQNIDKLSYGSLNTTIYGIDDDDLQYPYSDHQGSVLNSQGYPGSITFIGNQISGNFAYISAVRA